MDEHNSFPITGPGVTRYPWITGLHGISGVSIHAELAYGDGGEEVTVYVQSSIDGGDTAFDIAAFAFRQESKLWLANVAATWAQNATTPPVEALEPGQVFGGILGDRLRVVAKVNGTYRDTFLRVAVATR